MIISHKYKFIFIKTKKVAGTSIEVYLSRFCDDNDIFTPIYPEINGHVPRNYSGFFNPLPEMASNIATLHKYGFVKTIETFIKRHKLYGHMPAHVIRSRIPKKIWNDYFKFTVERNPWEKTLSHYSMLAYRSGGTLTFDEYMSRKDFCFNYPLYTDGFKHDRIIVDHIIKYENLSEELREIFLKFGIPFNGSLNVKAKSGYRKDRREYQEFFSPKYRDIIGEAFKKEIAMHGYIFE